MTSALDAGPAPQVGELVRVRGQQWVVSRRSQSRQPRDELAPELPGRTLLTLTSVSDDDLGSELTVAWDVEPGREVLPETRLPQITESGWDDPVVLGAFLDAVRWGTVASADDTTLQAPFRAGITIEDYQLEPVAKALAMPRVRRSCSRSWSGGSRTTWSTRTAPPASPPASPAPSRSPTRPTSAAHTLLQDYVIARRRVPGATAVRAGDLIGLLLKKRLFSSPAAFAKTLAVHRRAVEAAGVAQVDEDLPAWLVEDAGRRRPGPRRRRERDRSGPADPGRRRHRRGRRVRARPAQPARPLGRTACRAGRQQGPRAARRARRARTGRPGHRLHGVPRHPGLAGRRRLPRRDARVAARRYGPGQA